MLGLAIWNLLFMNIALLLTARLGSSVLRSRSDRDVLTMEREREGGGGGGNFD